MSIHAGSNHTGRTAAATCVTMFAAVVGLYTYRALSNDLWDDALFFQRVGTNIVEHQVAAWNVDDGPVYGNTSQLFQFLAAAVVAAAPGHYHLTIKLLLGASVFVTFLLAVGILIPRLLPREETERDWGPLATLLCGFSAPTVLLLIGSGMETLVALCVLALFLAALVRAADEVSGSRLVVRTSFVAAHILVYLVRPDMIIISMVASAVVLFDPNRRTLDQRRLLTLVGWSAAGILIVLMVLRAYYGTAFPLSFYLKNRLLSPYDQDYQLLGVGGERRQLVTWLAFTGVFAYIASFRLDRWSAALLVAAGAFVAYHYASTIGIMGYHTRFFVPASLPVILAAARAWPTFASGRTPWQIAPMLVAYPLFLISAYRAQWIEAWNVDFYLGWLEPRHYAAFAIPMLTLVAAPLFGRRRLQICRVLVPLFVIAGAAFAVPPRTLNALDDGAATRRMAHQMSAMTGIFAVKACVQEPAHLYHSELGVPGVLFPRSRITDLTGLMNPRIVFDHPAFDDYCLEDPPEVLFLPHATHVRLNEEILGSRCFQLYSRPSQIPASSSTLYIRSDLIGGFEACQLGLDQPDDQRYGNSGRN